MAYTNGGLLEVPMTVAAATLDLTSTGDKARYAPGLSPVIVRGVVIQLNAIPGDAGVVKGDKRPTFGSDTSRGDGDVFVLNMTTSHAAGNSVYKMGLNATLNPGQELVIEVTDASAAVNAAKITLLVEPSPEQPANITAMKLST